MSDWLERDPKNGMLIGPDGCHYDTEHDAVHYGVFKLCGCGCPEDAYNFLHSVLKCFDRRGCYDNPPTREWIAPEDVVAELIKANPADAAHVFSHLLNHMKVLEHGGSVGGSWATRLGERVIDMGPITEEEETK